MGEGRLKQVKRVKDAVTIVLQRGQDPHRAVTQGGTDFKHVGRFEMADAQVENLALQVTSQAVVHMGRPLLLVGGLGAEAGCQLPDPDQVGGVFLVELTVEEAGVLDSRRLRRPQGEPV